MSRKKETITLSIPPGTKAKLEAIARRLGIMWGKSPSISGLIVAIAEEDYELGEKFTLTPEQIKVLDHATQLLTDTGFIAQAETLLQLILDRGNLDSPTRQAFMKKLSTTGQAWRTLVEDYRQKRQPFRVLYRNAKGEEYTYTARYVQFDFHEKRYYLQIWCDETEDVRDSDFPELNHNRCLRRDRIQSIIPTNVPWREAGLDTIKVHLHFYRGLANAYEGREVDIEDEMVDDVRRVVREVANPFWLLREIRRYGPDCDIISPPRLRELLAQEHYQMWQRYSNPPPS
jgi:predicted DNA-binding transcriptional regulator YafY